MTTQRPQFPLVDALLFTPTESADGSIGICTNTTAPGQVYNDIGEKNRADVAVLGPLIVSRDGTERMILNALAHPSLRYLILFSEESLTFAPSTNLLLALMYGLDESRSGNFINKGQAASAHFPNLSKAILDLFREHITVLPLYMSQHEASSDVVADYLAWLAPRVDPAVHAFLVKVSGKQKKYFDVLNELIALVAALPTSAKPAVPLDPQDFQHLQPPLLTIANDASPIPVPFRASIEENLLRLDIALGKESYFICGEDDFRIEYSLMKFLGERKRELSPLQQLLIGAELNRVNVERMNNLSAEPFTIPSEVVGATEILLEPTVALVPDQEYYYKVGLKDDGVSVMCMAFDICEEVFELRSPGALSIFKWLSEKNRFQNYEMDILHRMDVGGQIGRAAIAAKFGYSFIQDFSSIFKVNKEVLPLVTADSDTFLDVHRSLLLKTYTEGISEEHGDERKGLSRTATVLAIYRDASRALAQMPAIYQQGEQSTEEMREAYKTQLLRLDHDGDYSYGERTRVHFGFDQLDATVEALGKDPSRVVIIQRYDTTTDMGLSTDPDTGRMVSTHDPCLTHDILFVGDGKLHALHIARAHNLPNAYPENIFGLYDAYDSSVRERLGLASGDFYMLSSRGNILLLVEEQRVRKIIAEPSKPVGEMDRSSGPHLLGENVRSRSDAAGVSQFTAPLVRVAECAHPFFARLAAFEGVDTIERAVSYLEKKGSSHNNPILGTHQPGKTDAQGEHLAFFQANVFGGKLWATVVFANHVPQREADLELICALATRYADRLAVPLGSANIFYVNA